MNNTPDIGLLLELNAERRAIAEMLEAESRRLAREDTTPRDGAIDYAKRAVVGTYATAAEKVRARIVVGIATEDSTPNSDGTHSVNVRLIP